jgi:antitoxin component YwqK of YwqJK toxin-antitoxin module
VEPKEDEDFVYLIPVLPGEKPEKVFLVSFNGTYETFYDDGAPNSTIEMEDGLLHGESLHFDRDSNLISKYQFSEGLKHGIAKTYYPGKVIKSVTPWARNKRHGQVLRHIKNGDTQIYTYKHGVLVGESN